MHFDIGNRAKPVLKWAGGKSALLPQLIPLFPQTFNRYFEPFLGGAAVFLSLQPHANAVLNELNPEIYNLYQVLRTRRQDLIFMLQDYAQKYSKEFYYSLRSQRPQDPIERAARTLFLNKTGFNGLYRQNAQGDFNVPFGHRKKCPQLFDPENFALAAARFAKVVLHNSDFASVISLAGQGDFVYCDPPYEPLSATSSFNSYTRGGFSLGEQQRLRDVCVAAARRGATIAISNSTAPALLELYAGFDITRIRARRAINSKALARGEIDEVVIRIGAR
ncbi:DNA adenine methylase [bacterium]|nr:DNA adenine methylase [bacterium]